MASPVTMKGERPPRYAKSCANILEEDESSWRPGSGLLHRLARHGSAGRINNYISSLSLQMVPDHIESRNLSGSTPLHVATYYGNSSAVSALQKLGANRFYKNKFGWNAGHYAGRWSQPLDSRLPIGLEPVEPTKNSNSFSFKKIRDRKKKSEDKMKEAMRSDSGISVCDSKESLLNH